MGDEPNVEVKVPKYMLRSQADAATADRHSVSRGPGGPKKRSTVAVMRRRRSGETIIPGRRGFEWSVVDRRGEKGQRGRQTRESPAHFPASNTPDRRRRCSRKVSPAGSEEEDSARRRAVGRGRGKPQRSQSQESSCRTNRCNSRPPRRGSPSGVKLCSAGPFWDHPSGWLGAVQGARE
jgi:hypothetical protein